ncbi:MAG: DUF882 domain-containing protein [Oxalobacter sp.]|nr:DUF882 domain-containing protein [Oxalobacter sp.]
MKLTEHFTLEELLRSDTAKKRGIDNTPPEGSQIYANLEKLAGVLEEVRALFGKPVHINSGYRCPELNKAVGGVRNSAHLTGYAVDIRISGVSPKEVTRRISASDIQFDQCIDEGTWTHFSIDPRMRRQAFKAAT